MSDPQSPSSGAGRSRIVVNLEEPQEAKNRDRFRRRFAGTKSGARGRSRRIIVVVLAAIVAGLFFAGTATVFWWQSFKESPSYSLALLIDAAERKDRATFDELIDLEQVTENLISQAIGKSHGGPVAGVELPGGLRLPADARARLVERIRGEVMKQADQLTTTSRIPFFVRALGMRSMIDQFSEEDEQATVELETALRPISAIGLTMQRNGERWKIVALRSDALVSQVLDAMGAKPPVNQLLTPESTTRRGKKRRSKEAAGVQPL